MSRLVKCQDTGEKISSDIAFKVCTKRGNKYWSSEDAYNTYIKSEEDRLRCISAMLDILNYSEGMFISTWYLKKLKEWKNYGYDVVLSTISNKRSAIEWCLSAKEFKSEDAKVRYICAIIQNNLNDEYLKKKKEKKIVQREKTVDENILNSFSDVQSTNKTANNALWGDDLWN